MDNQWKDIFDNAEMAPSPRVWEGIESGLGSGGGKKAFMIPLAWAAAISLALASTILIWYNMRENSSTIAEEGVETPEQIAPSTTPSQPTPKNQLAANDGETENPDQSKENSEADLPTNSVTPSRPTKAKKESSPVASILSEKRESSNINEWNETEPQVSVVENHAEKPSEETNPYNSLIESPEPKLEELDQDSLEKILQDSYYSPDPEDLQPQAQKKKRKLWAGISQGYGGFASNFGGANENSFAAVDDGSFTLGEALASEQQVQRDLNERGLLNTALWVGIPINHSLALMTGLGYARTTYSSTGASYNGKLLHFTADPVAISESGSSSYQLVDIEGTYDMAFVPVVLDWALLQGQLGLSLQAGPEMGILLQQKIKDEESGASRTSGAGNLYRPIHFRLSSGVALTYQVKEHYQISLQPRATQAFTSVTSSDASFSSYPLNYSLMLGFRYIF